MALMGTSKKMQTETAKVFKMGFLPDKYSKIRPKTDKKLKSIPWRFAEFYYINYVL